MISVPNCRVMVVSRADSAPFSEARTHDVPPSTGAAGIAVGSSGTRVAVGGVDVGDAQAADS